MDCSKCIFAEFSPPSSGGLLGVFQTGCSANRLETLKKLNKAKYSEDKSCYELDKFCNLYRTNEWEDKHEDPSVSMAKKEIQSTFGVVIYDSLKATPEDLEVTVSSLLESEYDKSKISVVLSTLPSKPIVQMVGLVNRIKEKINRVTGITHLVDEFMPPSAIVIQTLVETRDKQCFQKLVDMSYFVKIKAGKSISPSWFSEIDTSLNERLEQVTLFENNEGVTAIPCGVVRSLYLDYNNYDTMTEKLKEMSKTQDKYKLLP